MDSNYIDDRIDEFLVNKNNESLALVIDALIKSNLISINTFDEFNIMELNNKNWFVYYTSTNHIRERIFVEVHNHKFTDICTFDLLDNLEVEGIVINPYTQGLFLDKIMIGKILDVLSEILVGDNNEEVF